MSPHTPKWIPTLGVGVPMNFQFFKEQFEGTKLIGLKSFLYHWIKKKIIPLESF
jgi:hypothetical protein